MTEEYLRRLCLASKDGTARAFIDGVNVAQIGPRRGFDLYVVCWPRPGFSSYSNDNPWNETPEEIRRWLLTLTWAPSMPKTPLEQLGAMSD